MRLFLRAGSGRNKVPTLFLPHVLIELWTSREYKSIEKWFGGERQSDMEHKQAIKYKRWLFICCHCSGPGICLALIDFRLVPMWLISLLSTASVVFSQLVESSKTKLITLVFPLKTQNDFPRCRPAGTCSGQGILNVSQRGRNAMHLISRKAKTCACAVRKKKKKKGAGWWTSYGVDLDCFLGSLRRLVQMRQLIREQTCYFAVCWLLTFTEQS